MTSEQQVFKTINMLSFSISLLWQCMLLQNYRTQIIAPSAHARISLHPSYDSRVDLRHLCGPAPEHAAYAHLTDFQTGQRPFGSVTKNGRALAHKNVHMPAPFLNTMEGKKDISNLLRHGPLRNSSPVRLGPAGGAHSGPAAKRGERKKGKRSLSRSSRARGAACIGQVGGTSLG